MLIYIKDQIYESSSDIKHVTLPLESNMWFYPQNQTCESTTKIKHVILPPKSNMWIYL